MEIKVNSISYVIKDSVANSCSVGLYGSDSNGNFVNVTIKIELSDLTDGKVFEQTSQSDLENIAKNKLVEIVAVK
ncbi:hypothetical protein [Liquorilactobacillus mali]|uniref:hypothetical protein n=1 Tax=Liquorilactobacillus mali TaxID=1618 RepID=UPI00024914A0|nr:hypothetical protein [Liquorilactobacillus mali]EJE97757.1 hypothetical protein LMA_09208 [Liquorilactobacillus mali KCTC 3596 = DSM 20444]